MKREQIAGNMVVAVANHARSRSITIHDITVGNLINGTFTVRWKVKPLKGKSQVHEIDARNVSEFHNQFLEWLAAYE